MLEKCDLCELRMLKFEVGGYEVRALRVCSCSSGLKIALLSVAQIT